MKGVRRFRDKLNKDLEDPDFKSSFEEEELFVNLAIEIARLREEKGLTQKDLAKLLKTSQQMISRLESPGNESFSLKTLVKLANAFHKKILVQFVPETGHL